MGTGGGIWLRVIQSYCVLAAGAGGVFVYGSLLEPNALHPILVFTFRVGAVVVLFPSILALWGGLTGGGELAPLFLTLGGIGVGVALVLAGFSTRLDTDKSYD
ncbi:hypothetical protein ACFQJC_02880 [Haloferax namakaokahaiae]|uniref:EamA domain-containing protein n=1 Tax=Haloferax namakaokahaiae TaxID=1748331 RepID=A0ABD5ZB58_9EURY